MDELSRDQIIELFDTYQTLLTEKQREYFMDYYFNDYSLSEIAVNYNVSRNAVFTQLKSTKNSLIDYENKLHIISKISKIDALNINKETKNTIIDILKE